MENNYLIKKCNNWIDSALESGVISFSGMTKLIPTYYPSDAAITVSVKDEQTGEIKEKMFPMYNCMSKVMHEKAVHEENITFYVIEDRENIPDSIAQISTFKHFRINKDLHTGNVLYTLQEVKLGTFRVNLRGCKLACMWSLVNGDIVIQVVK